MLDLFAESDALISPCGLYRYNLRRCWDTSLPVVCWIMLNPSTATAEADDPTIRRIVGFSKAWGFGTAIVVNLYAYRATDPMELLRAEAPVGLENDRHILNAATGKRVIAAWGAGGGIHGRDKAVMELLAARGIAMECLGTTKEGHPRHPLYLAANTPLVRFGEG